MTILAALKRTTAVAAIAALPFAPVPASAESAQVTGTQPPAADAQAGTSAGTSAGAEQAPDSTKKSQGVEADADKSTAEATQTQREAGKAGTQSGESTEQAQQPQQEPAAGAQDETGTQDEAMQTQGEPGKSGTQSGQAPSQGDAGQQAAADGNEDALVAKVGDREIRRSDVLTVIGMLPAQLQQQPPEMLIPIALDQLVMRELILQEAKDAGLESDPAVSALDAGAPEREKEDAMVQTWLEQELGKAVTEEKVQETYTTLKQQMGDQAPDVETLRPQIEQELRQQAFLDLSRDLQEGAEITLYGPDGQAVTQ